VCLEMSLCDKFGRVNKNVFCIEIFQLKGTNKVQIYAKNGYINTKYRKLSSLEFTIKTLILLGFKPCLVGDVCIAYFPIQNLPKICPKRSSLLTSPVISDNVDRAARMSMASKSPGI
jgi:hypothetical protein